MGEVEDYIKPISAGHSRGTETTSPKQNKKKLTLLNAVLLGTLEVGVLLLSGDTLNALVVVVLVRGALGGVGALCGFRQRWSLISPIAWR